MSQQSREQLLVAGYLRIEGLYFLQARDYSLETLHILIFYGSIPIPVLYHFPTNYIHQPLLMNNQPLLINNQPLLMNNQPNNTGLTWGKVGKFVVKVAAKTTIKVGLNTALPGASSIVDLGEAAHSFYNGDYIGGFISTGFGIWDFVTLGAGKAMKEAYNEMVSETTTDLTKSATKEFVSDVGEDVLTDFGKDSIRNFGQDSMRNFGQDSMRNFGQDSMRNFGQDSIHNFGQDSLRNFGQDSMRMGGQSVVSEGGKLFVRQGAKSISSSALMLLVMYGVFSAGQQITRNGLKEALKEAKSPFIKQLIQQALKDIGNEE